jgi:hypothetical protein
MIFCAAICGGAKMSVDEYDFRVNTPILYGFYTSEIQIRNVPYPTLVLTPADSFKESSVVEAEL